MSLEVGRCNFTLLFTCSLFKYGFFDRSCTFLTKTFRAVNILMFVVAFCEKKKKKEREREKKKKESNYTLSLFHRLFTMFVGHFI